MDVALYTTKWRLINVATIFFSVQASWKIVSPKDAKNGRIVPHFYFLVASGSVANCYDFLDQDSKSFPLNLKYMKNVSKPPPKHIFLIFFCKICIKSFAPYAIIWLFKHNIQIHSETWVYIRFLSFISQKLFSFYNFLFNSLKEGVNSKDNHLHVYILNSLLW